MEPTKVQRTTLTMKEAAEYLGISYWLINQLVRQKQIPCSKVGGKYLFRVQVLDEYLNKKKSKIQLIINSKVRREVTCMISSGSKLNQISFLIERYKLFSNFHMVIHTLEYGYS